MMKSMIYIINLQVITMIYIKKEKLTDLLNNLLDKDLENYDKIFNFFESININT